MTFLGAYGQSNLTPDQQAGTLLLVQVRRLAGPRRRSFWPSTSRSTLFIFRRRDRAMPPWLVPVAGSSPPRCWPGTSWP
ncbi:MAG: hypothetical protein M0C28_14590 [Candidatus Moduliflexus flocculans]|nr:hypothetical protein [Candidatus Moduliflexus flocculans]